MYETHDTPTATLTPAEQVVELVNKHGEPMTVAQLVKDLKPLKKPAVEALVQELVDRRELFVVDAQERTRRYWTRDLGAEIGQRAEECLAAGPRGEKDVVLAVKQALGTLGKDKSIKAQLAALVAQGRLYRHPGKGRTAGPLARQPFDALAALTLGKATMNDLRAVFAQMRDHGVAPEAFLHRVGELVFVEIPVAAAPAAVDDGFPMTEPAALTIPQAAPQAEAPAASTEVELANLLLKVMQENGSGIPVPVAELRLQMPPEYRDKDRFDRAVWQLVDTDQLYLNRHDYPAALTPEEREALLADARGEYYAYVVLP